MSGTGTRLRQDAALAELEARATAKILADHIRSLPEGMRHHYFASAPLPPEAEEAHCGAQEADAKGDVGPPVCTSSKLMGFFRSLFKGLPLAALYLCASSAGAGAVPLCRHTVEPVYVLPSAEGLVVGSGHAGELITVVVALSNPATQLQPEGVAA